MVGAGHDTWRGPGVHPRATDVALALSGAARGWPRLVIQGLSADQVRAVSYGEDRNRLIRPGAWGDDGLANRRVALVIDFVETVAAR